MRHAIRMLAAATVAAGLALAITPPAGASLSSSTLAGWQASGRQFRYAAVTTRLPTDSTCAGLATISPGGIAAEVTLDGYPASSAVLRVATVPSAAGCGPFTAWMDVDGRSARSGGYLTLRPGSTVRLRLAYSTSGQWTYGSVTVRSAATFWSWTVDGAQAFTSAAAGAAFSLQPGNGTLTPFTFTQAEVVAGDGQQGTLGRPWATEGQAQHSPSGGEVALPSPLTDGGRDFSVTVTGTAG